MLKAFREAGVKVLAGDWTDGRGRVSDRDITDAYVDRLVQGTFEKRIEQRTTRKRAAASK